MNEYLWERISERPSTSKWATLISKTWDELEPEYQVIKSMLESRNEKSLTQKQLMAKTSANISIDADIPNQQTFDVMYEVVPSNQDDTI